MKASATALFLALLFQGCAIFRHSRKTPEAHAPPRLAGSVAFVNDSLHFVLVDVGSFYSPASGDALKTFRDGKETGVLTVTAERKRPFVSADIARGEPRQGDDVFQ